MARGKKTGGRDFKPGQGRRRGAKDKVPRSFRATVREMYQNILAKSGGEVEAAMEKRMKDGDYHLIINAADYLDGRPVQRVALETPQPITFVLRAASPTPPELPP